MLFALGDLGEAGLTIVVFEVELFHLFDAVNVGPQLSELSAEKRQSPIEFVHFLCPSLGLLNRLIHLNFLFLRDLPLEVREQLGILRLEILHTKQSTFLFSIFLRLFSWPKTIFKNEFSSTGSLL